MANQNSMYDDVRDLVESEIEKITKKSELDEKSLMYLDKLIDIEKDTYEIEMGYEQFGNGYSQGMYPYYGNSYQQNSYRQNGNSNRNGGYSRNGYGGSYRSGGYSREGGDIMSRLETMMDEAQTEHERNAIRRVLESM